MNNAASSEGTEQAGQRPPTTPGAPSGTPYDDPAHPQVAERPPTGPEGAESAPN
ncbi:hypothetical protein OIM90_16180 [Streptomyces sp. AD16]|nr:hypothetical protein NQP46_16280 [Streptomyces albus]WDV32283.1 hypothetical protein OIM90_16180 [Streptomyces sp. AD16]